MKPVTALERRRVECVSDLTIDRWLLGETPGSDEARRLEEHMKGCTGCTSRIGALRGLYSTQAGPTGREPPVRLAAPPAATPGQTGAVQFLILRDGLLLGSEFFTPGTWIIGSDPRADLQLDEVMPIHARIYFRDGRVAVKAEGGVVLVSGFKIDSCEVRSIDEVIVGPYVLRTRIIRERWSDVHPAAPTLREVPQPEPVTVIMELPPDPFVPSGVEGLLVPPSPSSQGAVTLPSSFVQGPLDSARGERVTRLTAELWWGDTRQQAQSFQRAVTARDFTLWGFDSPDGFVLAEPAEQGAFTVHAPSGAHDAITLEPGATHTFTAGPMRLTLRVDAVLPALPRTKFEGWPVTGLAAVMMAGFLLGIALTPEPEEQPFTPKTFRQFVTLMPPQPKVKTDVVNPRTATADPKNTPPTRAHQPRGNMPPRISAADPFASLKQITGDRAFKAILDATKKAPPGHGRSPNLFAGLGAPGGKKGFDLDIGGDSHIGAVGARTGGELTGKRYGTGRVGGQLDRPSASHVGFHGGPATSIDKDALARAIADHLHEVSSCYERALITNGNGGGRLSLEWTVTTSGIVAAAKVKSSTLKDGSIATCVLTALKGWRFPQAKGGSVVVSYPFVFQSSDF